MSPGKDEPAAGTRQAIHIAVNGCAYGQRAGRFGAEWHAVTPSGGSGAEEGNGGSGGGGSGGY